MLSAQHRDENYVEYRIYPPISNAVDQSVDDILEILQSNILAQLSPLLISYIWEKEPFALRCASGTDGEVGQPPHLHGVTRFGDNIEDEWFIVNLIYQITRAFPGSVASIQDNDGEILLIEAAHHLPKWLDPDTSKNRVFISNGELHIVPYPNTPGEIAILPVGIPVVEQSVRAIQMCPHLTKASTKIRNAIQTRLKRFTSDINANFHHAICSVPVKLAAVLQEDPHLISAAVEAFYERDPIDLKACRVMKHFPPDDIVATKVKMSRTMYARLVQQRFQPDRRSNWRMPATSNPRYKSADIGMKITHGFEILASRASEKTSATAGAIIDENNVTGVRWERFLVALKEKGFFQNELEGSKKYRELLTSAKKYFAKSSQLTCNSNGSDLPGHKILRLLSSLTVDVKAFKETERHLPDFTDDSWLTITPEQLDTMLETASGQKVTYNGHTSAKSHSNRDNSGETDGSFDPELIANSFHSFVEKISSHEGVEFPKGQLLDSVNFDPAKFTKAIEDILRYESEEGEEVSCGSLSDHFFEEDLEDETEEDEAKEGEDEEIKELMNEMDRQLFATEVGKSFERSDQTAEGEITEEEDSIPHSEPAENDSICEEEKDDYRPVEVDVNLLKNILESYSSQQGLAGPASTILHSMGVRLPPNADA
ncbi:Protein ecdysoneless-like [Holothuria leucospilota]|uniref:Protein ecdysoneless-like n=1 Tax=Holothuria leucospilota TaxID=206669 RepID=A0A9Q1H9E8_HOLLE|nr:Protein ecdysoneless-like [Holothuria leucospilota]